MSIDGKIPPSAKDAEEVVVGAILLEPKAIEQVIDYIDHTSFYYPQNSLVFKAAYELYTQGRAIDMVTVINELRRTGELEQVGGAVYISGLTSRLGSSAHIIHHAMIIKEKAVARKLIFTFSKGLTKLYDDFSDPLEVIEKTSSELQSMISHKGGRIDMANVFTKTMQAITDAVDNKTGISGVTTGLPSVDKFIGGFSKGDLIVVGGLSGTFKTALTLFSMRKLSEQKIPVHMFEMEMSEHQMGMRIVSQKTGIPVQNIRNGNLSPIEIQAISNIGNWFENPYFTVDFYSNHTILGIVLSINKLVSEKGVRVVVIDYLGLCDLSVKEYGTQEQAIDAAVKKLKKCAKDNQITIILLVQINREGAKEYLSPPKASQIKGSGSIEAHSDLVLLTWNPSYIQEGFEYEKSNGERFNTTGYLGLNWVKNRQGDRGLQWIRAFAPTNNFADLDDIGEPLSDTPLKPNIEEF